MKKRPAQGIADIGDRISAWVADAAAQPICQASVITFCLLWWVSGLPTDILTATLSILAITLTQTVLNRQSLREDDDRRRDIAMHAKLDELLRAESNARQELAGTGDPASARNWVPGAPVLEKPFSVAQLVAAIEQVQPRLPLGRAQACSPLPV